MSKQCQRPESLTSIKVRDQLAERQNAWHHCDKDCVEDVSGDLCHVAVMGVQISKAATHIVTTTTANSKVKGEEKAEHEGNGKKRGGGGMDFQ